MICFIFGCAESCCCTQAFCSCGKQRILSSGSVWASHCSDFTRCRAWALNTSSVVMVHGMWNVPGLVIRLSAALAGGFSTTDHQGSREVVIHCNQLIIVGNTYYHRKRWSETGVGNFFFPIKGQKVNIWLYMPNLGPSCNHSTLSYQHQSTHRQYVKEWVWLCLKKKCYLQKQKTGWIWPAKDSLWIPGPENSELSSMVAPCSIPVFLVLSLSHVRLFVTHGL